MTRPALIAAINRALSSASIPALHAAATALGAITNSGDQIDPGTPWRAE